MEHCTTRFFEACDLDNDKYIALEEWASCFGIKEREYLPARAGDTPKFSPPGMQQWPWVAGSRGGGCGSDPGSTRPLTTSLSFPSTEDIDKDLVI